MKSKKAIIYTRFSDEKQSKGFSIELQKEACLKFCDDNDMEIVCIYEDKAKTGTNAAREAFQEMYSYIKKYKNIDYCIVWKLDRFGRNISNYYMLKAEFNKYKCEIKSVTESIGTGPESILMEAVYNGLAESESKRIGIRARAGMLQSIKSGVWQNGMAPLGYIRGKETKKLEPCLEESLIIISIFDTYVNKGKGLALIAQELNNKGYKTKRGSMFTTMSIRTIISNSTYLGHIYFSNQLYENTHKPIIEKEIFDKAQTLLKSRVGNKNRVRNNNYILSGLISCSCGSKVTGISSKTRGKLYQYYQCIKARKKMCNQAPVNKSEIENKVQKKIKGLVCKKTMVTSIATTLYREAKQYNKENSNEKSILIKKIKTAEKQISNIISAIARIGTDELDDKLIEIRNDKEIYEQRLNQITKFKSAFTIKELNESITVVDKLLKDYCENITKKEIDKFVDKIEIGENKTEITLKCSALSNVWLPKLELIRNKKNIFIISKEIIKKFTYIIKC